MNDIYQLINFSSSLVILTIGAMLALYPINLRFLHFLQQEEYDNRRFLQWWISSRSFEKRTTGLMLIFALALWLSEARASISELPLFRVILLSSIIAASIAAVGWTNRAHSTKKALVMTSRVKRILTICLILQVVFLAGVVSLLMLTSYMKFHLLVNALVITLEFIAIPLFLTAANLCLAPYESLVQRKFLNEAKSILARIKPEVIGITGSYGKTSFKHILAHILASHAPTLATPGSVNTLMGITRIIRERLRNDHAYFIVEMGAYGIGSIKRLCGLTPPDTAIVTAVGLAHMERFKSIETVARAKSELPQALPNDGSAVLCGDDPNVRAMAQSLKVKTKFYGSDASLGQLDCWLKESTLNDKGLKCTLEYEGKSYSFDMPLYGRHQALNATGAFLTAMTMFVAPVTAIAALQSVPPIAHRLVVHKDVNGVTTIDDAYNSNPTGFENALDALESLSGSRKILITPGMVELGDQADEAHRRIAAHAASRCDQILLVAAHRLEAFRQGLIDSGFPKEKILLYPSLSEAQQWLNQNLQSGDVVLYENDLPDLYETQTAFSLF